MKTALIGICLFIAACAASRPSTKRPEFENLRVLPRHIAHDDLYGTMRTWSKALGVQCDHCHLRTAPRTIDFVTDRLPEKNAARAMLVMTRRVNADTVTRLAKEPRGVTCNTCHRGKASPDA